jgi:Predicted transcriptional regulators
MNSSNSVDINGNKIRLIREQKGLTQLYLATVVGVTTDTISRWENRRYPSIKLENAKKLAEALEVSLEELLEMEADREPDAEIGGEEAAADKAVSSLAGRIGVPWPRGRWWILAGAGVLIVAALAWAVIVTNRSGMEAVRIMPAHTAPNLSFPVLIRITGALDAGTPCSSATSCWARGRPSARKARARPRSSEKILGGSASWPAARRLFSTW